MIEKILDWVERHFPMAVFLGILSLVFLLCVVIYNVGDSK